MGPLLTSVVRLDKRRTQNPPPMTCGGLLTVLEAESTSVSIDFCFWNRGREKKKKKRHQFGHGSGSARCVADCEVYVSHSGINSWPILSRRSPRFHHLPPVHSQLNKTAECVAAHPRGGDG